MDGWEWSVLDFDGAFECELLQVGLNRNVIMGGFDIKRQPVVFSLHFFQIRHGGGSSQGAESIECQWDAVVERPW